MEERKFHYKYIIFALLIVSFFIPWDDIFKDTKNEQLKEEYPHLLRNISISGIIDTSFSWIGSNPKGALYVTLDNGLKFRASTSSYPTELSSYGSNYYYLEDFLKRGDSIVKPQGRDSLYVFKNGRRLSYFLPTKEYSDSVFHRR